MQVFISTRKTMQYKNITDYADTRQHLNDPIVSPTGASHKQLHINPNKKKERKKETCDFPSARRPSVRPPCASRATCVSRASRATCAPPARPLVHSACTPTCAFSTRPLRALYNTSFTSALQHVRSGLCPDLFWARSISPPIARTRCPSPRPFLASEPGRGGRCVFATT